MRAVSVSFVVALSLAAQPAGAGECRLHRLMSVEQQLRRTSLALRGHIPSVEEYAAVSGETRVPDDVIDAYLDSDAYRLQMRRYHESLLWTNPGGSTLFDPSHSLAKASFGDGSDYYYIIDNGKRAAYRGGNGTHACQNRPQSELGYRPDGLPVCEVKGWDDVKVGQQTVSRLWCQEGYELVAPYWLEGAPPIKVCAFDAQAADQWISIDEDVDGDMQLDPSEDDDQDGILDQGEDDNGNGILDQGEDVDHNGVMSQKGQPARCDYMSVNAVSRLGCGCGPALAYCAPFGTEVALWGHWREQVMRLVDDYTRGERPYSEMLTTQRTYLNGPLMHYYANLAQQPGLGVTYNVHHAGDAEIPASFDWHDAEGWTALDRSGPHAGILTLPGFTLRFQTNRGRANKVRIAFMDQYFSPPSVYEQDDCDPSSPDLTQKCVCRSCHAVLEPLAAYFGQIAERGSGLLSGFSKLCLDDDCAKETPEGRIEGLLNRFYVTDYSTGQQRFLLAPLAYADDHPEFEAHYDAGPIGLVTQALAPIDGKDYSLFARATVKNLFRFVLKRDMNLDPQAADNEIALMEELAAELSAGDDFTQLVRRLVALDAFRRMP